MGPPNLFSLNVRHSWKRRISGRCRAGPSSASTAPDDRHLSRATDAWLPFSMRLVQPVHQPCRRRLSSPAQHGFRIADVRRDRPIINPTVSLESIKATAAALLLIVCVTVGSVTAQQQTNPTAVTLAEFDARVKQYVALHRKLANETGEIDETKSPRQITDREVALGKLIRAARAQARRGDMFTPAVEALFKQLIRDEFARRSPRVRKDRREDQDELADFTPIVNQVYPSTQPLVTFPAGLLRVLPKLPRELEYRLVQRNLILRDIEANVIIDFIPAATP